jgi:type IV pilus assembly protein PilN
MIRINLLPVRQVKKVQLGQRLLLFFVLFVAAELLALFSLYQWKSGEADDKKRIASMLEIEIAQLKKLVGDFDQLKAQRDRLLSQREVINNLQKGRTGPVWVMRELSDILTPGKGPTINQPEYEALLRNNPNAGFNPRWNPNRLWIESFKDDGGVAHIQGKAKDYDDVAEFNKRISLSKYFSEEFLERNDQIMDPKLGIKVVKFSLRCRITY